MDLQAHLRENGLHVVQKRERDDGILEGGEAPVAGELERRRFPRLRGTPHICPHELPPHPAAPMQSAPRPPPDQKRRAAEKAEKQAQRAKIKAEDARKKADETKTERAEQQAQTAQKKAEDAQKKAIEARRQAEEAKKSAEAAKK